MGLLFAKRDPREGEKGPRRTYFPFPGKAAEGGEAFFANPNFSLSPSLLQAPYLEYDAQSETELNDAIRVYEEKEPQIVIGAQPYMFEPEYKVDEQVLAEPAEDKNMDSIRGGVWVLILTAVLVSCASASKPLKSKTPRQVSNFCGSSWL
ncbi:hypothetical protein GWK47_002159 [Chionoecetes opilio]|uniref:Uncharacterized protein n=1 Tax=Chionoecetes opilio TaxID=41210 RepID=A0A8J4XQV1_CHIOP|nr:hypothetical protein GWK47_002159 [Chionoecetes opilio]